MFNEIIKLRNKLKKVSVINKNEELNMKGIEQLEQINNNRIKENSVLFKKYIDDQVEKEEEKNKTRRRRRRITRRTRRTRRRRRRRRKPAASFIFSCE